MEKVVDLHSYTGNLNVKESTMPSISTDINCSPKSNTCTYAYFLLVINNLVYSLKNSLSKFHL